MAKTFNTKLLNFDHDDLPEEISSDKSFKELLSKLEKIKELLELEQLEEGRDFIRSKNGDILFMTPGGDIPIVNPSEKSDELYNLGIEIKTTLEEMLNQKLFEYAYDELPENEMAEIEAIIAKDPEALKIVNEYLFLKQSLKDLPLEAPQETDEETTNKNSILVFFIKSASKYIAWDIRPNLAFAVFAVVMGFSILQFEGIALKGTPETDQAILKNFEITEVEKYFNALQNEENPEPLSYITIEHPKQKSFKEDCIEVEAKLEDIPTRLKFCIVGDKYEMVEQAPTIKIKK